MTFYTEDGAGYLAMCKVFYLGGWVFAGVFGFLLL